MRNPIGAIVTTSVAAGLVILSLSVLPTGDPPHNGIGNV